MTLTFTATVLFIFGLRATLKPGMIFFFLVKRWYVKDTPIQIRRKGRIFIDISHQTEPNIFNGPGWHKPLYYCAVCMASFWGSLSYFLFIWPYGTLEGRSLAYGLVMWLIWVFCVAGANYIISNLMNR